MAVLFLDGFDKYGGVNSNQAGVASLLAAGEWTTAVTNVWSIVTGLSATGQAISGTVQANSLVKTLPASYSRLIGGLRFSATLGGSFNAGISFQDAGTFQCSIVITPAGLISLRNGNPAGTALGTSAGSISTNTTHYLEWDITFGNSAAYQVWLDGVSLFSGTGDTTGSANNTANQISLGATAGASIVMTYDDFYLFDSTGTTNNAVLLTSPRIETTFPVSDGAVQFGFGAAIIGSSVSRYTTNFGATANQMYLRPLTPGVACTLNSIGLLPAASNGTIQLRPVVYADSSGVPGALLSAGSTVTGVVSGTILNMPLTTPQSLTAGTRYWLGMMYDNTLVNAFAGQDALAQGRFIIATFASGAPGTAGAMTSGQVTAVVFGNVTGTGANYYEVSQQPPPGINSYVFDATVGHEDLYTFGAFSQPPVTIHTVAVKAYAQKSDSGTRTVSMRTKSGATDSGGSNTGQALGTSFGWLGSFFPTDPNTSAAWSASNLNAATSGFKIDS